MSLVDIQLPINHFHVRDFGLVTRVHAFALHLVKGLLLKFAFLIGWVTGASAESETDNKKCVSHMASRNGEAILVRIESGYKP